MMLAQIQGYAEKEEQDLCLNFIMNIKANFSQKEIVKETRKSWFIMNNLMKHIERYIQDYAYIGEPSKS